jgi:hypothetical protein
VIEDVFAVAIDRMQRNFAPMLNQVNAWKGYELPDAAAKLVNLPRVHRRRSTGAEAPREGRAPALLRTGVRRVQTAHDVESLERVHLGLKELDPVPRFKATAKLAPFRAGVPDFGLLAAAEASPALVNFLCNYCSSTPSREPQSLCALETEPVGGSRIRYRRRTE